jgi:hypothetical protein
VALRARCVPVNFAKRRPIALGPASLQLPLCHPVERRGDRSIPLLTDMHVHPSSSRGGVTHPAHKLGYRGARLGGERVSGVAQIVHVSDGWEARLRQCPCPRLGEIATPELATLHPTKTKPSGPDAAYDPRWAFRSAMISSGRTIVRRPAVGQFHQFRIAREDLDHAVADRGEQGAEQAPDDRAFPRAGRASD